MKQSKTIEITLSHLLIFVLMLSNIFLLVSYLKEKTVAADEFACLHERPNAIASSWLKKRANTRKPPTTLRSKLLAGDIDSSIG